MTRVRDQAEGLRMLPGLMAENRWARVITVAGGRSGAGRTSAVVNLAAALARQGKHVLVLDENPRHNNVNANLGLKAHYDLMHVINRDKTLDQVILPGPDGISVLTAMRGVHSLSALDEHDQEWLVSCFGELSRPVDIVLVDAPAGHASHAVPLILASQQVLIVLTGAASSITESYRLIKLMSKEYAKRHFLILVNKVETEEAARTIFRNISEAARQHLSASLDFMGYIPNDEKLRRSTQLSRSVVEAFPTSLSAVGFRKLAEKIVHSPYPGNYEDSVGSFMQRLIRTSRLGTINLTN